MRPARKASRPASTALLHGARHQHRVARRGDGGVHQHAVAAQLHGDGGVGGGADAGVDDHRHLRLLDDELQVPGIEDAHARADQRGERHDGDAADRLEHLRHDRIVGGVHHHLEAFLHQRLGRRQRLGHVRVQRVRIAQHLELDEVVAVEQLAREAQRAHRVVGACSSRRCWAGRCTSRAAGRRAGSARWGSGRCWCGGSRR